MAKTSFRNNNNNDNNNNGKSIVKIKRTARKGTAEGLSSAQRRSSVYRGVSRHRWTGRYEAHLWDKNCWNESQNKKGRQVYLGAYDDEEAAAHAFDLAALKYWGHDINIILNFPISTYEKETLEMDGQTKEEYIGSLRRKSSGFSRGVSKYRGVARHHHNGRWEARIGRVFGNKYLYLGTYATQEEAATAYDMAAIEYRGLNAVTNFDLSRYIKWIRPNSNPQLNPNGGDIDLQNPNQQLGLGLGLLNHCQESSASGGGGTTAASTRSALGLLLQSSNFKEMLKQITECNNPSSSSSSLSSSLDPNLPRSYFPDDIQTSFDIQDSSSFAEEHGILFGDYDSFTLPMFHCDELQN